jgi:hypothetical protein
VVEAGRGVLAVGNVALTVVLLQKFAEMAAKLIPQREIIGVIAVSIRCWSCDPPKAIYRRHRTPKQGVEIRTPAGRQAANDRVEFPT